VLTSKRPARLEIGADQNRPTLRVDWVLVAALAGVLLVFFGGVYPLRGYHFPVGPDTPVYLWWTRLAAHDGLSAVWLRPGVPSLVLTLAGSLGLSRVEALAGLGAAGGVCVGLASCALVELGSVGPRSLALRRLRMVAAGVLAGTFAVHLADGFFANLVQAALFLGAVGAIAAGTTGGVVAAAGLLAAGALTHPQFFLLGCGILILTALWTVRRRPTGSAWLDVEGGRILAAVGGGGLLAGAGLTALAFGSGSPKVDTSQDAFLRRAGLHGLLRKEYRGRFIRHLARFVLEVQVPLGGLGLTEIDGFLARFLGTWAVVLVVGVIGSVATGLVPAVRFFAFAFVLPILAALGLVKLGMWIARRNRVGAVVVSFGLVIAVALGATFTWLRAKPFVSRTELERVAVAGRIASATPPGTPIVFVVDTGRRNVSFLATRVNNVARDAVPPGRIRDVYVYVGSPPNYLRGRPTLDGQVLHDAMSRLYLRDILRTGRQPVAFVLAPFDRPFFELARTEGDLLSRGVIELRPHPRPPPAPVSHAGPPDLPPSSGWLLALSALAVLALIGAVGFGWARTVVGTPMALALAPAFGLGGLVLVAILLERLGFSLTGAGPPLASAIAGGGGYLTSFLRRRRVTSHQPHSGPEPPSKVS